MQKAVDFNLNKKILLITCLIILICGPIYSGVGVANPGNPEVVSVNNNGEQSNNGVSSAAKISKDGRFIAYMSQSDNLGGQRQGAEAVYVYDRETQTIELASVDSSGQQENGVIFGFAFSGDGRHVAFSTNASNLDPTLLGGNTSKSNVYVRDLETETTTLVSLDNQGQKIYDNGGNYSDMSLSDNGTIVAFISSSVTSSANGSEDLPNMYIRDIPNNSTQIIESLLPQIPMISGDGSKVLYMSPWHQQGFSYSVYGSPKIFNRADETSLTSWFGQNGIPNETPSIATKVDISHDGRFVLLFSSVCALKTEESEYGCLLKTDMQNHVTQELVIPNMASSPSFSDDGNIIAYQGIPFYEGSNNQYYDEVPQVYTYDILNNEIKLVTENNNNEKINAEPSSPVISGSGKDVVFISVASNFGVITSTQQAIAMATDVSPPPVSQTLSLNSTSDTYLRGGQTNRNHGADTEMNIQSSGSNRGLMKFDQSAIQSAVGGGTVTSAKLRLTITDNGNNWGNTGRTLDIHRLLQSWTEGNGTANSRGTGSGATWDCAVDSNIQNQSKDCSGSTIWEMGQPNNPSVHPWFATPSATQTIINDQTGVMEFDVTADVVAFLNGSNQNYGWLIKKTNEGQNGQVSFGTKESSFKPELVITYQP